jgi:hypothetical protein
MRRPARTAANTDNGTSEAVAKYDIVYLLTKSTWGEEIRYSLRSFERFFPDMGTVWIVGYLPPYLNPGAVRVVPEPKMPRPGVFVESVARRIINEELELSDEYVFAQDDNYVLKPVTIDDFGPLWVQDLDQVSNRGTGPWQLMLWRTYDLLKFMGLPAINYESHTPQRVNREKYREVAQRFIHTENAANHRYHSVCTTSAYWNIVGVAEQERRWALDHRIGFSDGERNQTEAMIRAQIQGKTFVFHNDAGLNDPLKKVIQALYPEKSRFEL